MTKEIAILGAVGVPANYGGFETLAENLVGYHETSKSLTGLTVYCSKRAFVLHPPSFGNATLRYVGLQANGIQSILYDMVSLIDAVRNRHDRLLLLGVSGALILPFLRLLTRAQIITNVDGIEWKRQKWRGLSKQYLKFAEKIAVRASHVVIADNDAIVDYLKEVYDCNAVMIPYGGDHAVEAVPDFRATAHLPESYALGLCRIEPENNIGMILEAFEGLDTPLVFVGNWEASPYGRALKAKYADHSRVTIHDPVYDSRELRAIRSKATLYIHGHSAGGTNPALVEMMHFGIPIAAYGCMFNRNTTEGAALYFETIDELRVLCKQLSNDHATSVGGAMREIARRRYTWSEIGRAYFRLLEA